MNGVSTKRLPTILFFFYVKKTDYLLKEAKLKNIPVLALINSKTNSMLVDYPIIVDTSYFHTLYFFSLFFFRIFRLH